MRCTVVRCGVMLSGMVSCGGFGSLVGWFVVGGLVHFWFAVDQLGGGFVGAWLVCWLAVAVLATPIGC